MIYRIIPCFKYILSIALAIAVPYAYATQPAKVSNLKCEYLINPIGIDAQQPRLTWMLADDTRGARQTAYQLFVGTDSAAVSTGRGDSWQTAKIPSDANLVNYRGKTLQPFTKYYWRVAVWEAGNKTVTSGISSFETGMIDQSNWKGTWISDNKDIHENGAPYFRHVFTAGKKIKSARAYIAVAGLYELYLTAKK
jgi:alpha-L-rhamnosidase